MDSVHRSSLPPSEKLAIQRFYESARGGAIRAGSAVRGGVSRAGSAVQSALGLSHHTVVKGGEVLRSGGEALLLGGGLGLLDAQLSKGKAAGVSGLDYGVSVGSYSANIPIDGVVGVAAFAASMVPKLAPVAEDFNRAGVIGVASWSARMAKSWMQSAPAAGTAPAASAASGEFGQEDAVMRWAAAQG